MQIPAPLPSDSDKVVNLLQNAALFDRIGDTEEALHWLRQAAECAGDSGDDARTLALARSAAELSRVVGPANDSTTDAGSGVRERRLPEPPPRSRPPQLSDRPALEEEPVLLLKRTAPHSKPPSELRDSVEAKEDKPPDSRSTLAPPPLPRVRANGSRPPLASARPAATPSRPAPPSLRSRTSAPPSSKAPTASVQAAARAANGSGAPASIRSSSLAPRAAAAEAARPSLRQAARVSVERSSSDPGLLLVRVLEEGASAPAGCTEALLVSVDPNARPFSS